MKKRTKAKKPKLDKRYRINRDTLSLNSEEFCNQDPLCPFHTETDIPDSRRLRKKGTLVCR